MPEYTELYDEAAWKEIRKWRRHTRLKPPEERIAKPGPGQESVWDFPRPPRMETVSKEGAVFYRGTEIARSRSLLRILERSVPPAYYFPLQDIRMDFLQENRHRTLCEWKGFARYYDLITKENTLENAAWRYPVPLTDAVDFSVLADYIAFYPYALDCYLDGEHVRAQTGGYYGGWITSSVLGCFKGGPGTEDW